MPEPFRVGYTQDFLNAQGEVGWGDIALARYAGVPGLALSYLPENERVLSAANAGDYDALGVLAPRVTAELVDHAPRLAVVARFGVGYDTVDLDACTRNGVAVTITPDGVRRPMAAAAMALLLALTHRVIAMDRVTREGGWGRKLDYMGWGLTGRTLGVIGLGNIGRDFLSLAAPWGMRLLGYDPYVDPAQVAATGVEAVGLDALLAESDFVVVLCKLTDETHHLLNAERLGRMKPTAFLVNVARGPIVDEAALVEALRGRRLRGAGLDVFEQEPVDPANPLLTMDEVVLAPHALGWTDEAAWGIGSGVVANILAVYRGEEPPNVVNREVLASPRFQAKLAAYRAQRGA